MIDGLRALLESGRVRTDAAPLEQPGARSELGDRVIGLHHAMKQALDPTAP